MGNKSSKKKAIGPSQKGDSVNPVSRRRAHNNDIVIPKTSMGYSYPAPPMLHVDDIRPAITWYQDDEEKDEFDWAEVQADLDNMDDGNSANSTTDFSVSILNSKVPLTPRSVLAAASVMTGPLTNRSMITPSGRPGSFVEQDRTRSVASRRSVSTASVGSVSVSVHSFLRRHNKPPGPGLVSFVDIDEHARKAQKQHEVTFTALMDYLKQPIRFHKFSELMTARALIVWLASEKKGTSLFTKSDITSPGGHLSLIKSGKITHAEAYAVLCREAGLQCVLIDGVRKPSDIRTVDALLPEDRWTAVHVEGEWQLVHPAWICKLHKTKSQNFEYSAEVYGYHPDSAKDFASPLDENGKLVDKTKIKNRKKVSNVHPEDDTDYACCVECIRHDDKGQLVINVVVPHEGELALVINAQAFTLLEDRITKVYGEQNVVCVYLLRTIDGSFAENVHQKLARSQLQRVIHGRNIEYIRGAIDKCLRVKISQHDDEIAEAQSRAEFLEHRKGIMDGIHRSNFRVANQQLIKVSKYKHRGVLESEIRRLFAMRKQLKRLQEFSKYIPELRRAGDALVHIDNPPPEVHITMGALLLLLEEPDKYIESWEYIVHQLRSDNGRPGDGPIYKKMYQVADMFPSKNTRRKILTLLKEFHFEQVKRVSVPAAKFYVWVQKVMAVLQDLEFHLKVEPDTKQITVAIQGGQMKQLTAPETKPEPEPVKRIFDKDDVIEEEL